MSKKEILIVGHHDEIVATVVRLINNRPEWNGTGAVGCEEARKAAASIPFDVVLFGGGIDEKDEQELTTLFVHKHPKVVCLRHYGGGSGLLYAEIQQALL